MAPNSRDLTLFSQHVTELRALFVTSIALREPGETTPSLAIIPFPTLTLLFRVGKDYLESNKTRETQTAIFKSFYGVKLR
jgi:hypothetical protein